MTSQKMDVFYVEGSGQGFTCAVLSVHRSWDGALYADTNVRDWAGPNRRVRVEDNGVLSCDGEQSNCAAKVSEALLLEEGHQD